MPLPQVRVHVIAQRLTNLIFFKVGHLVLPRPPVSSRVSSAQWFVLVPCVSYLCHTRVVLLAILVQDLKPVQRSSIAEFMDVRSFPIHTRLFAQGDVPDLLYVVLEGCVSMVSHPRNPALLTSPTRCSRC